MGGGAAAGATPRPEGRTPTLRTAAEFLGRPRRQRHMRSVYEPVRLHCVATSEREPKWSAGTSPISINRR